MLNKLLFKHIDNSALIVFRIIFGLLCFLESVGAVFTGWIKRTLIDPEFTFNFIGFEFLQPLPGNWMYLYYIIMGIFGFMIMIGYKYRFSTTMFALMWIATYLMQKASYNNHYYFLSLLSVIMIFLPANKYYSIDVKQNPYIKSNSMPQWCAIIIALHMFLVYTYGSIAKMYPDWLDTSVIELMMKGKQNFIIIGDFLQQKWLHYFVAYGGILFDGLIVPLLFFKRTRKWAFFSSIFFHLFNSIVFQVGIFPYLSLAFVIFFFEPETIQKLFFKTKTFYNAYQVVKPKNHKPVLAVVIVYFLIQIALPIRHHFITDNVLWTEEGHRLSWRMMLRSKSGIANFTVVDRNNGSKTNIKLQEYLSKKQQRIIATKPDVMWQFAQRLKKQYAKKGVEVSVFVNSRVSVNGRSYEQFTDPKVDIAAVPWQIFKHTSWILPSKLE